MTHFCIKLLTRDCFQNALLVITFEIIYIEWFSINTKTYVIRSSTVCTLHLEAFCMTALLLLLSSLNIIWLIIHWYEQVIQFYTLSLQNRKNAYLDKIKISLNMFIKHTNSNSKMEVLEWSTADANCLQWLFFLERVFLLMGKQN